MTMASYFTEDELYGCCRTCCTRRTSRTGVHRSHSASTGHTRLRIAPMKRHFTAAIACAGLMVGGARAASAQPANDAEDRPGHRPAGAVEESVSRDELDAVIGELARLRDEV